MSNDYSEDYTDDLGRLTEIEKEIDARIEPSGGAIVGAFLVPDKEAMIDHWDDDEVSVFDDEDEQVHGVPDVETPDDDAYAEPYAGADAPGDAAYDGPDAEASAPDAGETDADE